MSLDQGLTLEFRGGPIEHENWLNAENQKVHNSFHNTDQVDVLILESSLGHAMENSDHPNADVYGYSCAFQRLWVNVPACYS